MPTVTNFGDLIVTGNVFVSGIGMSTFVSGLTLSGPVTALTFTGTAFNGGTFAGLTVSGTTITAGTGFSTAAGWVNAANFTGGAFSGSTVNTTGAIVAGTTVTAGTGFSTAAGWVNAANFTGGVFLGTTFTGTAFYGGTVSSTGDVIAYASDDRLKTKLGNIQGALEKVKSLNGFQYKWNDLAQGMGMDDRVHVGLSAQDVQKILPEVIRQAPINNEYLTIQYEKLVPLLIEAIKELSAICKTSV